MASEGPLSGSSFASVAPGTSPWSNPGNAITSDDVYASWSSGTGDTEYLRALNFGFSIPSAATIDGIQVQVERVGTASPLTECHDLNFHMVRGGVIQTGEDNKAAAGAWGTPETTVTYGGPSDLWGGSWTPADINAVDFGFAMTCEGGSGGTTAGEGYVDHITITVYYSGDIEAVIPTVIQGIRVARIDEPRFEYEW